VYLGRVEPDIGVDNDDVPRIEGGSNLPMTGHPTLWWRSKPPGLHTPQLCLPAGEINIVHMIMGTRAWGAC